MTTPTRQEIIDAHEALDCLTYLAESFALSVSGDRDDIKKLQQTTLAALPTKPQPTMDEIEWDSDKHFLTEAEHPGLGKAIMIDMVFYTEDTYIYVLVTDEDETYGCLASPSNLTPTGRRYTLTEMQE